MTTPPKNHSDYVSCINQEAFALVETHIMTHVFALTLDNPIEREMYLSQERPRNILDAIQSTAKQIVGLPKYNAKNGFNRLIMTSVIEALSMPAIEAISAFLVHFHGIGDTYAQDYLHVMKTLSNTEQMTDKLLDAVQSASTLHGVQGQLVYELLTTAHNLILASQAILKDDARYGQEKFCIAQNHMGWAGSTAHRYSPNIFAAPASEVESV
jgi:hypothetical protein